MGRKREEAVALLAPILAWFTEGFDTADLEAARTLLDDLETPPPSMPPADGPGASSGVPGY
jgi:hypothetical protein